MSILSGYGALLYWPEQEENSCLWHYKKMSRFRHVSDGEHGKSSHSLVYLRFCALNIWTGFVLYLFFNVKSSNQDLTFLFLSLAVTGEESGELICATDRDFKKKCISQNMFCGNFVLVGYKSRQTCLFWIRLFLKDDRSPAYGWKTYSSYQRWYMLLFYLN